MKIEYEDGQHKRTKKLTESGNYFLIYKFQTGSRNFVFVFGDAYQNHL